MKVYLVYLVGYRCIMLFLYTKKSLRNILCFITVFVNQDLDEGFCCNRNFSVKKRSGDGVSLPLMVLSSDGNLNLLLFYGRKQFL